VLQRIEDILLPKKLQQEREAAFHLRDAGLSGGNVISAHGSKPCTQMLQPKQTTRVSCFQKKNQIYKKIGAEEAPSVVMFPGSTAFTVIPWNGVNTRVSKGRTTKV
jgi:hypothetical protein